ncbi:MAG: DNA gyrase inhibitor YacG [Nitrosomonadales bacterium]|jgi:uncharacterized protein|nr:DNA gyrase inhibitor YacG [Nitrosomonadales bacterium]|tara:strand:+ start:16560 stop:16727 length:168 start_codon:yes stop_codon:yes gene_type:complete
MKIPCPTCKKKTDYLPSNAYRPFCSEKCKLIDLGAWASEEYHIPGENHEIDYNED